MVDKPVEGHKTDARPHPAGADGALLSGKEVAQRAWDHRMSPLLREWTMQVTANGGKSRGTKQEKAQCILDEFRRKVPYVSDPVMGEFMGTPDQLLCLNKDKGALCLIGGDCDEASITIGAALMSIGINYMVILSSHRDPIDVPTHVYGAFEDDLKRWVKIDGTTRYPVGQVAPYKREWWIEPGAEAKERGQGDFVGMTDLKYVGIAGNFDDRRFDINPRYPTIR
jgi:hypothetical protein